MASDRPGAREGHNGHGSAFTGYQPQSEFESRVIAVLDEVLHQLAGVRTELTRVAAQVAANTGVSQGAANAVTSLRVRVDEVAAEMRVLGQAAMVARSEAIEASAEATRLREGFDEERRAAKRERETDPDLRRHTDPAAIEP